MVGILFFKKLVIQYNVPIFGLMLLKCSTKNKIYTRVSVFYFKNLKTWLLGCFPSAGPSKSNSEAQILALQMNKLCTCFYPMHLLWPSEVELKIVAIVINF